MAIRNWRTLLRQLARRAFSLEPASAGNNRAARMAITAMTTSNSIKVNARRTQDRRRPERLHNHVLMASNVSTYQIAGGKQECATEVKATSGSGRIALRLRQEWDRGPTFLVPMSAEFCHGSVTNPNATMKSLLFLAS